MVNSARKNKKPTDEQLAAWQQDQLDPDNWLTIPEFGVSPTIGFAGFGDPLVHPASTDIETANEVRELVRVTRRLAQQSFSSLSALRSAFGVMLDKSERDLDDNGNPISFDDNDRVAFLYTTIMWDLKDWAWSTRHSRAQRDAKAIRAACQVADWAHLGAASANKKLQSKLQQFQEAARPVLDKTIYYRDVITLFPSGKDANKKVATHIFNISPMGDDGDAPFYFVEMFQGQTRPLIDRTTGKPISHQQMTQQVQKARQRSNIPNPEKTLPAVS